MEFSYQAFDRGGARLKGHIDAASRADALEKLNGRGLIPFEIAEGGAARASAASGWRAPGLAERAQAMRMLATLLTAEIPLDRALRLLADQTQSKRMRRAIALASENVAAGQSLSSALASSGGGFAADETGLIRAGEHSGALAAVLEELAAMLEARVALRGRVLSALVYPAVLVMMAVLSATVVGAVLIPAIAPLFEDSAAPPPAIVSLMLGLSTLVEGHGLTIGIAAIALAVLLAILFRQPAAQRLAERAAFRLPLVGTLIGLMDSARVCRTLGTLLRSGAAMQSALAATRDAARRRFTRDDLGQVSESVVGGMRLSEAMRQVRVLRPQVRQMISIGEETNRLDRMLINAAAAEEAEAAARIERLMTLLTPLLTIALGALIGGMIMSVMQAILSVNDLAAS